MTPRALTALLIAFIAAPALAQDYQPPRMPDGTPDFQGIWNNGSLTRLERPPNTPLVLSEAEVARREGRNADLNVEGDQPTDPDAPPLPAGDNVRSYDRGWFDAGDTVARVGGEPRASWIVDPPDGRLPIKPSVREYAQGFIDRMRTLNDDPETRSLADRCIAGGRAGAAGPPMLNNAYNNNYQIVQTPETIAIIAEMIHTPRLIRMGADEHRSPAIGRWHGHSIGHWDSDTLVVRTTNFYAAPRVQSARRYLSADAVVTERFTRVADNELLYEFTVDDPKAYTQPWSGEVPFIKTEGPIYEFACHEGNYAMSNILRGARREEALARERGGD